MSYAVPRPVTVAATAVSLNNPDQNRTGLNFHNTSSETKYLSTRRDVATSGQTIGKPLLQNTSLSITADVGDPTEEWFAIGTATGGVIVVTEEKASERANKQERLLADINGTLKTLVALLMKTR